MSYLGQVELKSSEIRRVDVTGSTSATHTLTWTPASEQSLIITINGIKQQNNYSISGTTLTLDTALVTTDEMEVIGILDIGEAVTPPDDSISTAKIQDDAVTADKLANSINTEIAANTAKVTNATHTGDVTGATALTIATDAVDIAMLSATGTADSTTFLRGDNAWASAGGGKIGQVVMGSNETQVHSTSESDDLVSQVITPSATSSSVLVTGTLFLGSKSNPNGGIVLFRDSTALGATTGQYGDAVGSFWSSDDFEAQEYTIHSLNFTFLDTGISTTSETTYKFSTSSFEELFFNRPYNAATAGFARSTITLMEVLA